MKKSPPQLPVIMSFQQFIKASNSGRRLTPSGKRITAGTIAGYAYVLKLLEEFEVKQGTPLRIQLLHKASMRVLQREKNYWARFFNQFSQFLYKEKKYYDNYVMNVFKILKTFFNYLHLDKGYMVGSYHKSFRIPLQQGTPVVLTPQQLKFLIIDKEFEHSLSPFLKRTRDIFVFGCTVGLRFSDLMALKKDNLINSADGVYLSLFTKKTSTETRIPLPEYAMEIIERNRRKAGRYLLPRLSSTNLNIQVKKLVQRAGWEHTIPKHMSCRGRMVELKRQDDHTWKFFEHITAHTMRRTAITTLLIMGVPETVVRKISGHAPGSKEFFKYVSISKDYMEQEVRKAYQKLGTNPGITDPQLSFSS